MNQVEVCASAYILVCIWSDQSWTRAQQAVAIGLSVALHTMVLFLFLCCDVLCCVLPLLSFMSLITLQVLYVISNGLQLPPLSHQLCSWLLNKEGENGGCCPCCYSPLLSHTGILEWWAQSPLNWRNRGTEAMKCNINFEITSNVCLVCRAKLPFVAGWALGLEWAWRDYSLNIQSSRLMAQPACYKRTPSVSSNLNKEQIKNAKGVEKQKQ